MANVTISELMSRYGVNDREMSLLFNIPERTVLAWRTGYRCPPDYVVSMISYILGLHFEGGLVYGKKATEKEL